jgi:hypothetical protein
MGSEIEQGDFCTSGGGDRQPGQQRAHRRVERHFALGDHLRQRQTGEGFGDRGDLENRVGLGAAIAEDPPLAMIEHTNNDPASERFAE